MTRLYLISEMKNKVLHMSLPVRSFVRAYNRYNILNTIRTSEKISRIDISRVTGLSQAAITGITSELIQEGLIVEKEAGEYAGGRRPVLLAINPEGSHVMGVNIKKSEIFVVIINFQARVKASHMTPLEEDHYSPEDLMEKITQAVLKCIWESNFSKDQISGIGISVPALVDSASGIIRNMPNYAWSDVDIKGPLQALINHRIYIDNDTNNLALGEHWFGEGKGLDDFIVVSLESGVGAGCVVNGQLMRGHSGMAAEFGHMVVDPNGPSTRSLNKGSISAFVGIDAILREAGGISNAGAWKTRKKGRIGFEDVLDEIGKGNPEVMEILSKAGRALGIGLSNLIRLFNPEKIIIAGRGVQAGNALFSPMYEWITANQPAIFNGIQPNIVIKPWANVDWAIGAGTLVLQEIYKSPAVK